MEIAVAVLASVTLQQRVRYHTARAGTRSSASSANSTCVAGTATASMLAIKRCTSCRAAAHGSPYATLESVDARSGINRRQLAVCLLSLAGASHLAGSPAHAALVDESIAQRVYEASSPGVVSLVNTKKDRRSGAEVTTGGTGWVWDTYGHVLTNFHVISRLDKSADVIQVVFQQPGGGTVTHTARIIATDAMKDLAVLQVDDDAAPLLQPLPIGTSSDLKIGQFVYAIGAPYGLSNSLVAGVVSGLDRSIPSPVGTRIYGAIQTDASINAGNSGGPLLDSSGRVVGINTATFTRAGTGRGSGVNFAIPIDVVRDVVPKLIVYGNSSGKRI